jgi:biopolymer transport protein ExbD
VVQPRLEEIIPPPTNRQPTELSGPMSSSDVTIPVFDEPIRAPAAQDQGAAAAGPESPGWIWGEGEDDDEEDSEEEDEPAIIEDQEGIEIRDEDGDLEELAPGLAVETHPPAGPAPHAEHRALPDPRDQWQMGEHDLDLEGSESRVSHVALPVVPSRDRDPSVVPDEDADPDASFSLARSATTRVEELDLAPMVDVAFNLVLFFMVTASTILYKTLEIPKPSGEAPSAAVAQGRSRSLDDLKDDFILVEIDDRGAMKLDHEPIEPTMANLVERFRSAREKTGRKAMLLAADFATPHRHAVLAYDAANEIGLGIAIAKPQPPLGPAPPLRAAPPGPRGPADQAPGGAS